MDNKDNKDFWAIEIEARLLAGMLANPKVVVFVPGRPTNERLESELIDTARILARKLLKGLI